MSLWGHLLLAQEKTVSGIVISTEDGLPMIGVAVVDKQTMNGVTTNEKGEFSMAVSPRTKTLHLSYLGYKTKEVSITGRSMKIEMEPDMVAIDEVMVQERNRPLQDRPAWSRKNRWKKSKHPT